LDIFDLIAPIQGNKSYFSDMTRRNFQYLFSLGTLIGVNHLNQAKDLPIIKPPKLKKGDRIGLIAPGSPIPNGRIEKALETVKNLGYEPVLGKHVQQNGDIWPVQIKRDFLIFIRCLETHPSVQYGVSEAVMAVPDSSH